jgi:hypothetical protein
MLGIDRLLSIEAGYSLRGFYIGKVVESGEDSQGRIKVRIEALFGDNKTGIKDSDLPYISMLPSTGCYIRPLKDDFVTVLFQNSIYEGFYIGHTVHSKSANIDLGKEFKLSFDKTYFTGKYDGTKFELFINDKKFLESNGTTVTVRGINTVPKGSGPLCAIPFDTLTGAPLQGDTTLMSG